jgi:hypothetical protein
MGDRRLGASEARALAAYPDGTVSSRHPDVPALPSELLEGDYTVPPVTKAAEHLAGLPRTSPTRELHAGEVTALSMSRRLSGCKASPKPA